MSDKNKVNFAKGSHYVLFIPPSWIFCGTVQDVTDDHVALVDAVWNESIKSEHGVFELCHGLQATSKAWPVPDGTLVSIRDILIAAPAEQSFKPLIKRAAEEKIKSA